MSLPLSQELAKPKCHGTIFDIKRFAIHDGPGIRLTVFFKGCPMKCWWCHNPEGIATGSQTVCTVSKGQSGEPKEEVIGRAISIEELMEEIHKEVLFFDESGGGVTFSGGEPLLQIDFLKEVLKRCHDEDIHTVVDTSGLCSPTSLKSILGLVDLFLFDLKLTDNKSHQKYTGVSNHQVLENLKLLAKNGCNIKIRIPIIPGITDSKQNISGIKQVLSEIPTIKKIALLPFHNIAAGKYERFGFKNRMSGIKALSKGKVEVLKKELESIGFEVTIGG